jgi:RNA polymerase sigma factor (sigma-70 family)
MVELRKLVHRARRGDLGAYDQIVRRFQDMAVGYSYSLLGDFHLAEDAAQEAFIAAYQQLPQLRDAAAFPGWFRRIVFKYCDRLKRGRSAVVVLKADMSAPQADPAAAAEQKELRQRIEEAIHHLPERERLVTTLYYISEYSQGEISEFLEIPLTTVRSRLHTARGRLRERMMDMVREQLRNKRPSKNDQLADKVQLFNAVKQGDLDTIRGLLGKRTDLLEARDGMGHTPLHRAALHGHNEIVALLLEKGAAVDARCQAERSEAAPLRCSEQGEKGETPLHWAAWIGHKTMARALIKHGAEVEAPDHQGITPLYRAAQPGTWRWHETTQVADMLIRAGAEVDLFVASILGLQERVEEVLQEDPARINARGPEGVTPLCLAAFLGADRRTAQVLMRHGAELDVCTAAALNFATELEHMLAENPELVHVTRPWDYTPLHWAAERGHLESARRLLDSNANLAATCGIGTTPLHRAIQDFTRGCNGGNLEMVETLLVHGAEVNCKDYYGNTPLRWARRSQDDEIVGLIRRHGGKL